MFDVEGLLRRLAEHDVEFILVGGVAATVHGSARLTSDLDAVYARTAGNIDRLVSALAPLAPSLRGAPAGLPFRLDSATVRRGLNFTLTTTLGDIDLFGEIVGGGGYAGLLPDTREIDVFGIRCRCLTLDRLIEVKRAAGRPKDLEVVAELEALREEGAD
jgi:predicted nucleotidyltransferase